MIVQRKQHLVLNFPFFICGIDNFSSTIINSKKSWRNNWVNNKAMKTMRLNNRPNLFPIKITGIIQFFNYKNWEKLGSRWVGAWIDHCGSIWGSWYINRKEWEKNVNMKFDIVSYSTLTTESTNFVYIGIKAYCSHNRLRKKRASSWKTEYPVQITMLWLWSILLSFTYTSDVFLHFLFVIVCQLKIS